MTPPAYAASTRSGTTRRRSIPRFWPGARTSGRAFRALRAAPLGLRLVLGAMFAVGLWAAANWVYHALHKPTELLVPVSGALAKTPYETWRVYGSHFRRHATAVITPEFLAALAQVESAANPLAQTYWRWQLTWHPFEVYGPASSAVGMYQITDGTFAQTRRDCLHDPIGARGDSMRPPAPCWFDGLYTRVMPSRAVELTATLLDRGVAATLKRQGIANAGLQQKQDLAAVIHLCGARAGETYAKHGFRLPPGQRCGDHDVRAYLGKVNGMKGVFSRLAMDS